jgi:hypothetical protein
MAQDAGPTREATLVLSQMLVDRIILQFRTNFEAVLRRCVAPDVRVWIQQEDEFSRARVARQVQEALRPYLGSVTVTVEPDSWIPGYSRCRGNDKASQ